MHSPALAIGPANSVLLVDDDPAVLTLLETALRVSGTPDIVKCATGEEAVLQLEQRDFDVLVTDKNLPGMDGHQVIDAARAKHPHIGVCMITAQGTLESSTRGFRQRIDYYLLKPFDDINDFVDAVNGAYRTHAQIRALEQANAELQALLAKSKL